MKKIISIAVITFFVCLQSVYSQITTNELPISIQRGLGVFTKDKGYGTVNLSVPDIKKVLHEDSLYQKKNPNCQRTSVPIPLKIDMNKEGIWKTLEDGGKLWQIEINAKNAWALDFVFSKFWLPEGGKFFIFNPSTNETIGAITSQYLLGEKSTPKRFSTGIVKGDNIILEYYQPAGEKELPVILVEKAYYTYIPILNFGSSCECEVNINCSEGSDWQLEKNAVALVYAKFNQGGMWCSGSLLNNTQNNLSPLFLTANHCLELDIHNGYIEKKDAISDNNLSDWVFYWGYEQANCYDTIQPSYNKITIGAIVKANNSDTDFALLQLQQNPLNLLGYIPYYLGWDASGYSGTGGICIHHPSHDVKKISTYSCTPTTVSYDSSPSVNWAVSWIATVHGYGITETASSGSPLINNDHHVIGQLRGASISLNCSNYTGTSKYGKLSDSWTGYGNNDYRRRLDYWLDPSGSNTNVINGFSLYDLCSLSSLSGPSTICSSTTNTYTINNLPSGFTVNWSIDNSNFSISPSGNQCFVTYTGTPQYSVANLTATVSWSGTTIKTLTKRIVMHGTDLYVTGFQDDVITPDYTFPYREFTIPDNGGLGLLRIRPDNFDKDSIFGPESLPIHFIENHTLEGGLRVIDLCGYGITEINGDNRVYLNSTRFDGMDISFSGPDSPIYFNHNGSNVAFTIPYHASEYYAILNAYSEAGCHDFCLTFKVVPPSFYASGDDEIWVSFIGSTLYVTFMVAGTPVGNGQYYLPSYSLTINKIPSGTQVYSQVFPGDQNTAIINTSGWSSGLYSIRIVCNNHIYTKIIGI